MYLNHTITTTPEETTLTVNVVFDGVCGEAERRLFDQMFGMRAVIRAPEAVVLFADLLAPGGAVFRVRGEPRGQQADALREMLNISCREIVDECCCLKRLSPKPVERRRGVRAKTEPHYGHAAT